MDFVDLARLKGWRENSYVYILEIHRLEEGVEFLVNVQNGCLSQ